MTKINAPLYRLEKILLYYFYEQLSHQVDWKEEPDTDYKRGYKDGQSDLLEKFWAIIEDHNDVNDYLLLKEKS